MQAAIAVIERRGCYLICRRRSGGGFGGYWEFPGGKRRWGERWTACIRRELQEELGVRVRGLHAYGRLRHQAGGRTAHFRVFRCRIAAGRPRPLDAAAMRWVPLRQLARYRFPPANAPLLARLAGTLPTRRWSGIIEEVQEPRRRRP